MNDKQKPVTAEDIDFAYHDRRGEDGVFAEFDVQGRLIDLYYTENGRIVGSRLCVNYEKGTASTSKTVIELFPYDNDEYRPDGEVPLEEFVRNGVQQVYRSHGSGMMYCGFCEKDRAEVKKLIAGPHTFICNECVDLCNDILAVEMPSDAA